MIIYQWSSIAASSSSVENFKALATFRAYHTGRLPIYAIVIIALGAMGSASQALLAVELTGLLSKWGLKNQWPAFMANVSACVFLALLVWLLVELSRPKSLACRTLKETLMWSQRIVMRGSPWQT
jgi:hypothetical protein